MLSRRRLFSRFLPVALASLLLVNCRPKAGERSRAVVSVFPIYDLTRRIAGPDADVTLLVPPAASPRTFAPGPKEIEAARGAKVAVAVGLGLDPWMDALVQEGAPKVRYVKVGDRVPTLANGSADDAANPYVWLDPARARLMLKAIAEELARSDGAHAGAFRQRAAELDALLEAFERELEAEVASWPSRPLAAGDGRAAYFAERYHLELSRDASAVPIEIDAFGGANPTATYESVVRAIAAAIAAAVKK